MAALHFRRSALAWVSTVDLSGSEGLQETLSRVVDEPPILSAHFGTRISLPQQVP